MDQYIEDLLLGLIMTFLAQMILSGINEVATELENPFRNVPNELPVVYWQAEFNETLITMFSGFHPDFYWDGDDGDYSDDDDDDSNNIGSLKKGSMKKKKHPSAIQEEEEHPVSMTSTTTTTNEDTKELKDLLQKQGNIIQTLLQEQVKLNERLNKMKQL